MSKKKGIRILSPDGFDIEFDTVYPGREAAKIAFDKWVKRYEAQGYYSSNRGRIPLDELESHCQLIEA
jgi:hypothetical protein